MELRLASSWWKLIKHMQIKFLRKERDVWNEWCIQWQRFCFSYFFGFMKSALHLLVYIAWWLPPVDQCKWPKNQWHYKERVGEFDPFTPHEVWMYCTFLGLRWFSLWPPLHLNLHVSAASLGVVIADIVICYRGRYTVEIIFLRPCDEESQLASLSVFF